MSFLSGLPTDILIPSISLVAGFPISMLVLNELINYCDSRSITITPTLKALRNFVLPALVLVLFIQFLLGLPQDATASRLAETGFWICVLMALLTFINDVVFGRARKGTWQERVPTLFRDLSRMLLVALGASIIYSHVWDQEITGALTALGIGSVVLGLALQEPLGNIVSGLMLLFERPLNIGDWITAEGATGKVTKINWRSVHIETTAREMRIVPNVSLYKNAFSNLSRPTPLRTDTYEIGFSYDHPPNLVKEILLEMLQTTEGVLADPAPKVRTVNYGDFSVVYRLTFTVLQQEELASTRDRILTRLWYVSRRAGLNIPFPITMEYGPSETPAAPQPTASDLLNAFPRYRGAYSSAKTDGSTKDNDSIDAFPPNLLEYTTGEVMLHPHSRSLGFCLISNGKASLTAPDHEGKMVEIATLGPGEFFGEHGVSTGQVREFTVTALTDIKVIHLKPEAISIMLARSLTLASEVGDAIDSRRRAAQLLRRKGRYLGDSGAGTASRC